jgi:hypothetical protein
VIDGWLQRVAPTLEGDRLVITRRAADSVGVYHDDFLVTPDGEIVGRLGLKERLTFQMLSSVLRLPLDK